MYKYPGIVKKCPSAESRTEGLSPIYQDGGSVCITSDDNSGIFFGPNITTLPLYARCVIKNIRRNDALLRKVWMSPSNIYQESSLNMSTNFYDIAHFYENGLYSTGFFDVSNLEEDEKLLYARHHMKAEVYSQTYSEHVDKKLLMTDCVALNASVPLQNTHDIIFESFDGITEKVRPMKCVLDDDTDQTTFGRIMINVLPGKNEVQKLKIPHSRCQWLLTYQEQQELNHKLSKCFNVETKDRLGVVGCDSYAELRLETLSDMFCKTEPCHMPFTGPRGDLHSYAIEQVIPMYGDYEENSRTLDIQYSLDLFDIDLSGVDLFGADLRNVKLNGTYHDIWRCPKSMQDGYVCEPYTQDNQNSNIMYYAPCGYMESVVSQSIGDSPLESIYWQKPTSKIFKRIFAARTVAL